MRPVLEVTRAQMRQLCSGEYIGVTTTLELERYDRVGVTVHRVDHPSSGTSGERAAWVRYVEVVSGGRRRRISLALVDG